MKTLLADVANFLRGRKTMSNDKDRAISVLSSLDTYGTLKSLISDWVDQCPEGKAQRYAQGLKIYIQKKIPKDEDHTNYFRSAIEKEWGMEQAEVYSGKTREEISYKTWIKPSEHSCQQVWDEFGKLGQQPEAESRRRRYVIARWCTRNRVSQSGVEYDHPLGADAVWGALTEDREKNPGYYDGSLVIDDEGEWTPAPKLLDDRMIGILLGFQQP